MSNAQSFLPRSKTIRATSIIWLLTAGLILIVYISTIPAHIEAVEFDWVISRASEIITDVIPNEMFLAYVLGWQFFGTSIFLVCALIIFTEVILPEKSYQSLGFWVSLSLLLVPITLYLNAANPDRFRPDFWGQILNGLSIIAFALSVFGFVILFHILPFGKWQPRWTRWVSLITGLSILVTFGILFSELAGDSAWGLAMISLLVGLITGVILLVVRYLGFFTPQQKSQVRWIVVSLLLNLLLVLGLVISEPLQAATGNDAFALVELHIQLILPMLIPCAILYALLRQGLWNATPSTRRSRFYAVTGLAILTVLFAFVFVNQSSARAAAEEIGKPWTLPVGTEPVPLIVDTDFGNDDVLALLFLMQHPGVDLNAVTVVGTGLIHCKPGIKHVHGLLELTEYRDVPVACGSEQPLDAEHPFPQDWRLEADRLWGLGLPLNDRQPSPHSAPDLLVEQLTNAQQPILILALGPLTNLAQAFQSNPEIIDKIEQLYIMGGAVEVPGNVYDPNLGFDNRTAEWNIYADPLAARIVFESGVPITLVPLDATNHVPVNMPMFNLLRQNLNTRAAVFTYNIFYINQGWIQSGYYYLWDTLASAVLTNPEIAAFQDYTLEVITERGPDFGRTKPSQSGSPVRVTTQADAALFEALFLRVLNTE